MHIYLFTMLVMHGPPGTPPLGTERSPGSTSLAGAWLGWGWIWPLLERSGRQNWCSNQQAKSWHYPSVCSCPVRASVYCVVEGVYTRLPKEPASVC